MPALRDPQQERFCREVVGQYLAVPPSSTPIPDAYAAAGYRPSRKNGYRLARSPEVQRRIQELMADALEYSDVRIARAAVKLDRIASANITDFYDSSGRLKDITMLPPSLAEAICKIEFRENGAVKKIELHDKVRALTIIMKHLGGLSDERPVRVNNTEVTVLSNEQRVFALMHLFARVKEARIDGPRAPPPPPETMVPPGGRRGLVVGEGLGAVPPTATSSK